MPITNELDELVTAVGLTLAEERQAADRRSREQDAVRRGTEYVDALAKPYAGDAAKAVFAWIENGFGRELREKMLEAGVDCGIPLTGWLDPRGKAFPRPCSGSTRLLLLVGREPLEVEHVGLIGAGRGHYRKRVANARALVAIAPVWTVLRAAADVETGRVLGTVVAGLRVLRGAGA